MTEARAGLSPPCSKEGIPVHKEEPFRRMKNGLLFMLGHENGGDLAVSISRTITTMLRHFDKEERQTDGSRHWDSIKLVLERKFAREGARDFSDEAWLQKDFCRALQRREIEYCKDKDDFLCYLRAIQGHSGGISNRAKN